MLKKLLKGLFRKFGFDIFKIGTKNGVSPYQDMAGIVNKEQPMLFDVGANVGQTVDILRGYFPKGNINSFEPNPGAFAALQQHVAGMDKVQVWNTGLGSTTGEITFFENSNSDMSSFLELDEMGWGTEKKSKAQITTIDKFCGGQKIDMIDILKIDTQGFELEILKGAENMISGGRIGLIYCEVIFSKMYKNSPSFGDLFNFLTQRGYNMVSIYQIHYHDNIASWADVLFVHKNYIKTTA